MARIAGRAGVAALGIGVVGLALTGTAQAQMPPEAAEIGHCLCMDQEVQSLSADMTAKMAALRDLNQRVAALNARLRRERRVINVNDPAEVERYKALLERRDAARKGALGSVWQSADEAVRRYDAVVREYNGSCAHRLFDPVLLRQVRATLSCTAPGYGPPSGPTELEAPPPAGYEPPGPGYSPAPPGYGPPPGPTESEEAPPPAGYGPPGSAYSPAPPGTEYPPAPRPPYPPPQ